MQKRFECPKCDEEWEDTYQVGHYAVCPACMVLLVGTDEADDRVTLDILRPFWSGDLEAPLR